MALEFPCAKCGGSFSYSELEKHVCGPKSEAKPGFLQDTMLLVSDDSDIEVIDVKESALSSLGRKKRRRSSQRLSQRHSITSPIKEEDVSSPKTPKTSMKDVLMKKSTPKSPIRVSGGNFVSLDQNTHYDKLDHLLDEETRTLKKLKQEADFPLSEILRPKRLHEAVGNEHLIGTNGIITKYLASNRIPSMILWGPSGIGKTTLIRLILTELRNGPFAKNYQIYELSAASSTLADSRKVYETFKAGQKFQKDSKLVLFLDEIHRFSKLQQDFFLKLIEYDEMIFFGCTTENPSYKINDALLSRCQMFSLSRPSEDAILKVINSGIAYINRARILLYKEKPILFLKEAKAFLAKISNGDFRTGLNALEMALKQVTGNSENPEKIVISEPKLKEFLSNMVVQHTESNSQKDLLNALRKCILRGDANAATIYLAYLFEHKTDPLEISNFLHEILMNEIDESERRGSSSLVEFSNNVYYVITKIGLPECDLALVQFTALLCEAKKSKRIQNTVENFDAFLEKAPTAMSLPIPMHIRNAPTGLMKDLGYGKGYKYNPNYKDGKVYQRYLPKGIRKVSFVAESRTESDNEVKKEKDDVKGDKDDDDPFKDVS